MADDEVINPEMIIVRLVKNDIALSRRCPNCHKQFKAHDEVFVSVDEAVTIHVSCIVGLALVASVRNFVPATTEAAYEHVREYLVDSASRSAELAAEMAQSDG